MSNRHTDPPHFNIWGEHNPTRLEDGEYPDTFSYERDDYAHRFDSPEDDAEFLRGTSQCDGLCIPQCDWCLVAHACPDECKGGVCPYDALDARGRQQDVSTRKECDDLDTIW